MTSWIKVDSALPDRNVVVETKCDDELGLRNEVDLKRGSGRLWFIPSGDMYVYYTPTHWRHKQ